EMLYTRPGKFAGDGDVDDWLVQVRLYVKFMRGSANVDTVARVVLNSLEGAAFKWARQQLDANCDLKMSSAAFLEALTQEFSPNHDWKVTEAELD
ncbi:hypothetical protein H4R21_005543, partial [Coemansia helicoidea]